MKLHHRILGEENPETLVVLHGLFGSSDNWQSLGKRWAEDAEVILVDQRNHGRSPHDDEFNYDVMADDLLELVYDLRLTDIHLLGHSMGGKAAMRFAQRHPELIANLVVADIGPWEYPMHHDTIIEALTTADARVLSSRKSADEHLSRFIPEAGVRQFLMKNLYWKTKGTLDWRMNVPVLKERMQEIHGGLPEEQIDVPVHYMRGLESKYIRDADIERLAIWTPEYELTDFASAGHWLHADDPEKFYIQIRNLLED